MSTTITKIRVANAPCSWGALEFDLSGKAATFERVLDEMAKAGFVGTELGDWGFMPTVAEKLRAELQKRSLEMLAAFVPVDLSNPDAHAEGIKRAVRTAQLLAEVGCRASLECSPYSSPYSGISAPFVVLADDNGKNKQRTAQAGRISRREAMTDAQWSNFVQGAHKVAREVLRQTGLRTVFHHHCAGWIETPSEIERFLRATDPELIGLCFDTGHYSFGGGDPFDGLRKHFARINHVHFKDCDPRIAAQARTHGWDYFESVRRGIFCELGKGSVPFASIADELKRANYAGWIVVEQDVLPGMGTPFESAIRNREFLSEIGL